MARTICSGLRDVARDGDAQVVLVGDDMRWTPLPYESGLAYTERSSLDISGAPWPVDAAVESFARLFPRWSVLGVCHNQYVLQKDAAVH